MQHPYLATGISMQHPYVLHSNQQPWLQAKSTPLLPHYRTPRRTRSFTAIYIGLLIAAAMVGIGCFATTRDTATALPQLRSRLHSLRLQHRQQHAMPSMVQHEAPSLAPVHAPTYVRSASSPRKRRQPKQDDVGNAAPTANLDEDIVEDTVEDTTITVRDNAASSSLVVETPTPQEQNEEPDVSSLTPAERYLRELVEQQRQYREWQQQLEQEHREQNPDQYDDQYDDQYESQEDERQRRVLEVLEQEAEMEAATATVSPNGKVDLGKFRSNLLNTFTSLHKDVANEANMALRR